MEENFYNLGVKGDKSQIYLAGVANVVIPVDVDRAKYIAECFRTSTVSIFSDHNGFSNRVPVDRFTLNFIQFPTAIEEFGSAVSFKCDPIHKKPIIDGIYYKSDEVCDLVENQFKFRRELSGNFVELTGSPDGKYLGINVGVDQGGEVFINVKSNDESGAINIKVDGECNITSLTDTNIKQYGKLTLLTINRDNDDEYTLQEQTSVGRTVYSDQDRLNTSSYKINEGTQNFILGQLFKQYIKNAITEISNATVNTGIGEMPLTNADQIAEYAKDENIDKFLSTIGFIDQ